MNRCFGMRLLLSVLVVLALSTPPLSAQVGGGLPVMEPDTPLEALDTASEARGWEAIGRIDTGRGYCTGTLISPDMVLTAAHCLFGETAAERLPDAALTFKAGLRDGIAEAQRSVRRSVVHPDYIHGQEVTDDRVRVDIALLQLGGPINTAFVRPMTARGRAEQGDIVEVVSYGQGRENHASHEDDCAMLRDQSGIHIFSCHVVQGSSGAPVMIDQGDQLNIVAVVSAVGTLGDQQVAITVPVEGMIPTLMDAFGQSNLQAVRSLPQIRRLGVAGSDGRQTTGARFLRP